MNTCLFTGAIASLASLLMLASPVASAHDSRNWSLDVAVPGAVYAGYAAPSYQVPAYRPPQVVYVQPQPVVVPAPPAVYYVQPRPRYAPVYYSGYAPVQYGRPGWHHHRHWE